MSPNRLSWRYVSAAAVCARAPSSTMRGWVAISVTAMPAAAPRRIREVLRMIIGEPSGLRLRPTTGLDRREPRPCGTPVKYGLAARLGSGRLGSAAHHRDGLARNERAEPGRTLDLSRLYV